MELDVVVVQQPAVDAALRRGNPAGHGAVLRHQVHQGFDTKARSRAFGSHSSRLVRHVASSTRVPSGTALRPSSLNEGQSRNPGEPFSQACKLQNECAESAD